MCFVLDIYYCVTTPPNCLKQQKAFISVIAGGQEFGNCLVGQCWIGISHAVIGIQWLELEYWRAKTAEG